MVENVTLGLQGAAAGHVDVEVLAQDVEERLLHDGHDLAVALDIHRLPQREHLFLHPRQLVSIRVLQGEGLRQDQHLAIDLVDVLAFRVLDPEVLADRKDLPAQLVGRPSGHRHALESVFVAQGLRGRGARGQVSREHSREVGPDEDEAYLEHWNVEVDCAKRLVVMKNVGRAGPEEQVATVSARSTSSPRAVTMMIGMRCCCRPRGRPRAGAAVGGARQLAGSCDPGPLRPCGSALA